MSQEHLVSQLGEEAKLPAQLIEFGPCFLFPNFIDATLLLVN